MEDTYLSYLRELGSNQVAPGGGSALAYATALANALIIKSLKITAKRKAFLEYPEEFQTYFNEVIEYLDSIQEDILKTSTQDIEAFKYYMEVRKDHRKIEKASKRCFIVPDTLFIYCSEIVSRSVDLSEYIVESIQSDFVAGLEILKACINGCIHNMSLNIDGIQDEMVHNIYEDDIKVSKLMIKDINKIIKKQRGY